MAGVYCARDLHFPNTVKLVAIKEMMMHTDDSLLRDSIIQNFEREANILASLSHPAIPHIADYFTRGDRSYLILEFIQGKDLEKIINDTPGFIPEDQVIKWALEICDVLYYLHNYHPKPIVFRDMKPSNVMIDNNSHVFLIDFGIAKVFETGVKGTMIGTEGFSPPEQYRGEATPQADIYSLGATLHYLLTKVDPREEPPFTFHERKVRSVNQDISEEFENIINRAVRYKPEERYSNILEMKTALDRCLHGSRPAHRAEKSLDETASSNDVFSVRPVWIFECEDEIRQAPYYYNDMVYVGAYDRNLYAINANTGKMEWKAPTEGGIASKPAVLENAIYFGSEDKKLYSLYLKDGSLKWAYSTDDAIRSSPRIYNKVIYIGSDDGRLHAVSAESGHALWKIEAAGPVRSSVLVDDDLLYFGCEEGDFYCASLSGEIKWRNKTKRAVTSSPAVYQEEVIFASLEGHLFALDKNSGWIIWRYRMQKGSISSPLVFKDYVYVGSADGYLYCVDVFRPVEKWKFKTGGQIAGSPAVYEENIYCGSTDGYLYCLDATNGRMVWKYKTEGPITGSPVLFSHMLYIGSMDHRLYAIKV
ncbi:MAG: serine/threonine-protein kinase [Anaerolineaceae bacterium]|nr:serine/threonine-protein kinase [Anaerolineaceae bacterium]